jgi:sugar lactone lactonase YvrE
MAMVVECIERGPFGVGESPVWDTVRQSLWWVDIPGRALWCWNSRTGQSRHWPTPQQTGCIAMVEGTQNDAWPQWVAAMEDGMAVFKPAQDGSLAVETLAAYPMPAPGMRFNDGRCDRQGRFRAGTMVMDMGLASPLGQLLALDHGQLHPWLDGLITPNGMAFSPDGRTLYWSDSHPSVQRVWRADYDTSTGQAAQADVWIDFANLPGRPDGAAVDEDGAYWICGNDAGLVHRFTPEGRLDRSIAVPVKKPAMCAFGGPGMDTLFVTSIRPVGDLSDQPLAGGVWAFRPGVKGLEEPRCQLP